MTVERAAWAGTLTDRPGPSKIVEYRTIVERNDRTGSGAFKALTNDGRWWVKPLNNPQTGRVSVTEFVLGRVGTLIGAPVCDVAVVSVPEDVAGEEYRPGLTVPAGFASGSRHLGAVHEVRDLMHRNEDDNRRRHAGVFAFYDWCWGDDDQWIYVDGDENRTYSHDHGMYLPGGPGWSEATLEQHVDIEHPQNRPMTGVDPAALEEFADRLDGVTFDGLRSVLAEVPTGWPVTQTELEALGWFLHRRAQPVAVRIRALAGQTRGGSGS